MKSIPLDERPDDFKLWFRGGRKEFLPRNFNVFVNSMTAWWTAIQPDDRARDAEGKFIREPQDANWMRLRKGGRNGIYLVVVGLMWWRDMISNNETMEEWLAMVEDVTWVLESMVATHVDDSTTPPPSPPTITSVRKRKNPVGKSTDGMTTKTKRSKVM